MGAETDIAWCDSTVNDIIGCTKVDTDCLFCYAEAMDKRHLQGKESHWGPGAPRYYAESAAPLRAKLNAKPWICDVCGYAQASCSLPEWKHSRSANCRGCGLVGRSVHRRRIFSLSRGDFLDKEIDIDKLAQMFQSIGKAKECIHLLCTKRPELFLNRLSALALSPFAIGLNWADAWSDGGTVPNNICLIVSAGNQKTADLRVPELLKLPARWRALSLEPLLGPINIRAWLKTGKISWVIIGGESGALARPSHLSALRDLIGQCEEYDIPCFMKQAGSYVIFDLDPKVQPVRVKLKHPKGGDLSELPLSLHVRQFPDFNFQDLLPQPKAPKS